MPLHKRVAALIIGPTIYNPSGADADFIWRGDTATNLLVLDAGLDAMQIGTTVAGAIADFRAATITFNEAGADMDLRIESDTDINSIYMDGATGKVGFGTATPDEKLSIIGNFQLDDSATAPTKNYRFRTTGGDLDFDFAGKDMYFSGYPNADFGGTQKQYIVFGGEFDFVNARGNWEWKNRTSGNVIYQLNPEGSAVFNSDGSDHDFTVKTDNYNAIFTDASNDSILIMNNTAGKIGFYNATPIAKQTGVAVSAAGIHAALVSLGLIAA